MNSSRLSVEQERTLLRSSDLVERAGSGDAARRVLDQVERLTPNERVCFARSYARLISDDATSTLSEANRLLSLACYHWVWDEREAGRDWDPRPWWVPVVLAIPGRAVGVAAVALFLAAVAALVWGVWWLLGWLLGGGL